MSDHRIGRSISTSLVLAMLAVALTATPAHAAHTVTSISPDTIGQGATGVEITVTGTGFTSGMQLGFDVGLTVSSVTVVNDTTITALLDVPPDASTGTRSFEVCAADAASCPSGEGDHAAGCTDCLTVSQAPSLAETPVSPASRGQGAVDADLTITGTGFVAGATVVFLLGGTEDTAISATAVSGSGTTLTATVQIDEDAALGARGMRVTNPDHGTASCGDCFTVLAGPTVTNLSPSALGQGAETEVTITGTGFAEGAEVSFSGTGVDVISVTRDSATTLRANVDVDPAAGTGLRTVRVTNVTDAGSGTCECLTVNPAPTATDVSPASRGQGALSQTLTLTGTDFQDGADVSFDPSEGITVNSVTFVSATSLQINVDIASDATAGTYDILVTNPDGAPAAQCSCAFTVNVGPAITSVTPDEHTRGATSQTVTIAGTSFSEDAQVSFSGTGITVDGTTVTATSITATITIDSGAASGDRNVIVVNGDGGRAIASFSVLDPVEATFTRDRALRGTHTIAFDRPVDTVTAQNVVLRVAGKNGNIAAARTCRDGSDTTIGCDASGIRSVTLRPSSPLMPGQRYTLHVNPTANAASSAVVDDSDVPAATATRTYRASQDEEENSLAAVPRFRRAKDRGAFGGSFDVEHNRRASATFSFSGRALRWYPVRGTAYGLAEVFIDGESEGVFDLYASSRTFRKGIRFTGLGLGEHTFKVVVLGLARPGARGTRVGVDAFEVTNADHTTTLFRSPRMRYTWQRASNSSASGGRYARSDVPGASFRMKFRGTGFDWYAIAGRRMGLAAIVVDNELIAIVDTYASSARSRRYRIRDLDDAVHRLEIHVLGLARRSARGAFVGVDRIVIK